MGQERKIRVISLDLHLAIAYSSICRAQVVIHHQHQMDYDHRGVPLRTQNLSASFKCEIMFSISKEMIDVPYTVFVGLETWHVGWLTSFSNTGLKVYTAHNHRFYDSLPPNEIFPVARAEFADMF